ncbi:MAG TPA: nucleoside 2-deoxyribosyltransferase [Patescibacteria group bacterium]|nr:nucleoside 2-deoxyribosyltransferase [Patescibacteria group bacterium]
MKHIFLSTSFSGQVNYDTGEVFPEFRTSIETILTALRELLDVDVFCAVEDEGWKISADLLDKGVQKDIEEVDFADTLIALIHDAPSAGVQFEIGYAVAKGKQVILAAQTEQPLAFFNEGLVSAGYITLVRYDTATDLVAQLPAAVDALEESLV